MKKLISIFLLTLTIFSLKAQQGLGWVHTVGGTEADLFSANALTRTGLIVNIGSTRSSNGDCVGNHGNNDVILTAMNGSGAIVWTKIIGGSSEDGLNSTDVDTLNDGNIIAAFSSGSNNGDITGNHGGWDFVFQKFTPAGQLVWSKTYGGTGSENLDEVSATPDGGFIAIGSTNSSNSGDVGTNHGTNTYDIWIIKLDASGNLQWQKCFGGSSTEDGSAIAPAGDGGYYFASRTISADGDLTGLVPAGTVAGGDVWMSKINSTGTIEWSRQIGGSNNEEAPMLHVIGSSVYLAFSASSSDRDIPSNSGLYDVALFKYNATGTLLWKKIYASASWDSPSSIQHSESYISVTAVCYSSTFGGFPIVNPGGEGQILLLRIDTLNGALRWVRSYGGTQRDFVGDHKIRPDGQFVLTGSSSSNDYDIFGNHGDYDGLVFVVDAANRITGNVFIDKNRNGTFETTDQRVSLLPLTASRNDSVKAATLSNNGAYSLEVDTGLFVIRNAPYKTNYYTFMPDTFRCTFTNYYQTCSRNIEVRPVAGIRDLRVYTIPTTTARPAFKTNYLLLGYNIGTDTVSSGSISWKKDPRVTVTRYSTPPTVVIGDSVVWNFANFRPFDIIRIEIDVSTPPPPQLRAGDTLKYVARINPVANDFAPIDNALHLYNLVVGPFDPNEKINLNANSISESELQADTYINYVVHFQNVGTAPAFTVIVEDTLSSKLQPLTIEILAASHPYEMQVHGNAVKWRFLDINLPDSTHNEPGSHGFIAYRIKAQSNLAAGDSILNTAAIYFDYNDAVVTDPNVVKVYRPELITSLAGIPEYSNTIVTFPNPVWGSELHVLNKEAGRYFRSWSLINTLGVVVIHQRLSQNGNQTLNIKTDGLSPGVYLLKLETNKGFALKRVVVLN